MLHSLYKAAVPPKLRVQTTGSIAQFFQDKEVFLLLTSHLNWCKTDQNRGASQEGEKAAGCLAEPPHLQFKQHYILEYLASLMLSMQKEPNSTSVPWHY